jgi:tRNA G18 (ribose-2'-O)-methylase SpoU
MDAVVLSPSCADPLYRRSVRVSMGEVLSLPYARAGEWPGVLDELKAAGFAVVALTPAQHACSLDELTVPEKAALVLGAEGPGLHEQTVAQADFAVRIPMRRGVDSLNVAAAAAVACYVVGRRPFQAACPPKAE